MSADEQKIAALIAAAVAGAASGLGTLLGRRRHRRRTAGAGALPDVAMRLGALADRMTKLEIDRSEERREMATMKEQIEKRIDRLSESVDRLEITAASTTTLIPELRDQLRELRQDLRGRSSVREIDR